jgi:hypothetical protein
MRAVALGLACVLLASTVGATDLVVRQRSSPGLTTAPTEETVYLSTDTIVTDSRAMRTIVDLDRRTITSADKTKQTYNVLTFDELAAQMEAFRKALANLPPEARKQMGTLLDDGGSPVTLEPTGKTDTIAGYMAKEHALRGGPYTGSIWTTDAIATPPAFQKWKSLDKSRGGPARQLSEAIEKLSGFPLRTRIEAKTGAQDIVLSNEVIEVREGTAPADVKTVPPGFAKQTTPAMPPAGTKPADRVAPRAAE